MDDDDYPPASARLSLAEKLEAAGMTLAELAAILYDYMFGSPPEPPCRLRRSVPGVPRQRGCNPRLRRPTRRTSADSTWAPARIGCPRPS